MLVFNIIKSCCMVAGNVDHYFYLEKHDQEKKDLLLWKDAVRHKSHYMKSTYYALIWSMRWLNMIKELWLKAPRNGMSEEGRDREIWNHGKGNQHLEDQEYLTRKSSEKIWRLLWKSRKYGDSWKWIYLGDMQTCIEDVDPN